MTLLCQKIFSSDTFLTKYIILIGATLKRRQTNRKLNLVSLDPANFEMSEIYQGNFQS